MQHNEIPSNTMQYHTILLNNIWCNTTQYPMYNTMKFYTTPYNTVEHNTKQQKSMQCKMIPYNVINENAIYIIQFYTMHDDTIQCNLKDAI